MLNFATSRDYVFARALKELYVSIVDKLVSLVSLVEKGSGTEPPAAARSTGPAERSGAGRQIGWAAPGKPLVSGLRAGSCEPSSAGSLSSVNRQALSASRRRPVD